MLSEHRAKLSDADAKAVEAAIADTKKALEEGGADRINKAVDVLTQASHKVAEAMYKAGAQPGAGAAGTNGAGPKAEGKSEGDVIDAEYVDADDKKKE